jgi:uncharacterized MAPEG superfamily protein
MTVWIVLVLALFFVQSTLAPFVQWRSNIRAALGPRDNAPPISLMGARLDRAFRNMIEAMLIFIPLALLVEIQGEADDLAKAGAAIFLLARMLYVPAYASGVLGVRSAIWVVGHAGLVLLAVAVLSK